MTILPTPPDEREKFFYVTKSKNRLVSIVGLFCGVCFLYSLFLFYQNVPWLIPLLIFILVTFFYQNLSHVVGIIGSPFNLKKHYKIVDAGKDYCPEVDVFVPTCGEPLEIIFNTFKHVLKLRWGGKLNIYCLDDKNDAQLKIFCELNGIHHTVRNNPGVLKKAGNLRSAFRKTSAPFFAVFDADFCPRPEFLEETIPYFLHDEKIGIVQTPQFFRYSLENNWVENGAVYIQEFFYRLVQPARDRFNAAICVGSNAVYRREPLKMFGGTSPIPHSEDMHTGFMLIQRLWKVKYLPINMATGTNPDSYSSLFFQHYRWSMGSGRLFFEPYFWESHINLIQRLNYATGMLYYLSSAMAPFLITVPFIINLNFFPENVEILNYVYLIPILLFGFVLLPYWTRAPFGLHSMTVAVVVRWAYASMFLDSISGKTVGWIPTGAGGATKTKQRSFIAFKRALFIWTAAQICFIAYGAISHVGIIGWPVLIPGFLLCSLDAATTTLILLDKK